MQLMLRGNTWYVRYYDDGGRRQKVSTGTSNRSEAETFMSKFKPPLRDRKEIHYGAAAATPLAAAVSSYLEYSKLNHARGTYERNTFVLDAFQRFCGHTESLARISPKTIESFKQHRAHDHSRTTVNIEVRHLKAFFNWCGRMKLLRASPMAGVKQLKVQDESTRALTREEFARLLDAAPDGIAKLLILLAVSTGMRRKEMTELKWQDVDLDRRVLLVRRETSKSGKPRTIPLSRQLTGWLHSWRLQRVNPVYVLAQDSERYFGVKVHRRRASQIVHDARVKAGLDAWVRLHSLRHTFCTWCLDSNVPAPTVRDLAGHSSLVVTDIYAHSSDAAKRDAVEAIAI